MSKVQQPGEVPRLPVRAATECSGLTPQEICAQRVAVVREALEWEGTPYVSNARVKGRDGGCDCLTLLAGVFANAGMIPPIEKIPDYPADWHLHRSEEQYLEGKNGEPGVTHYCAEVDGDPLPGDVVMFQFARCFSHGAIVVGWPIVIHAWSGVGVTRDDAERSPDLKRMYDKPGAPLRPRKLFRLKSWL